MNTIVRRAARRSREIGVCAPSDSDRQRAREFCRGSAMLGLAARIIGKLSPIVADATGLNSNLRTSAPDIPLHLEYAPSPQPRRRRPDRRIGGFLPAWGLRHRHQRSLRELEHETRLADLSKFERDVANGAELLTLFIVASS